MATIPMPLLGRHLTSVVLTGQVAGTAGLLADGTAPAAVTLTAFIEGVDCSLDAEHEEISAMNATRQNNVIVSDGANINIEVLRVNNGGDPAPLRTQVIAYDYFKAVWIEGSGASQRTVTSYGVRGSAAFNLRGKGKQIASLSLLPIDVGSAQVTVV